MFTVSSTGEAKKVIDKHPDIAFAFVDYEIPTENGPSVIRYLKEKNPAARIALVSSSDSERYITDAKEAGAEAYICTSYQSDVVATQIGELIEKWQR